MTGASETRVCGGRGSSEERQSQVAAAGTALPSASAGRMWEHKQADDSGWGLAVSEETELGLTCSQVRQ